MKYLKIKMKWDVYQSNFILFEQIIFELPIFIINKVILQKSVYKFLKSVVNIQVKYI